MPRRGEHVLSERTTFKIPEPCPLAVVRYAQRIGLQPDCGWWQCGVSIGLEIQFFRSPISYVGRNVTVLAIFRDWIWTWTLEKRHNCLPDCGDEQPVAFVLFPLGAVLERTVPYQISVQDLGRLFS